MPITRHPLPLVTATFLTVFAAQACAGEKTAAPKGGEASTVDPDAGTPADEPDAAEADAAEEAGEPTPGEGDAGGDAATFPPEDPIPEDAVPATDISVPSVFADGMLIQQKDAIAVWGKASADGVVTVEISESDTETVVRKRRTMSKDGTWKVMLPPLDASFKKYSIIVSGKDPYVRVDNVLVGEVWLAGGQSNMQINTQYIIDGPELLAAANNKNIRIFYQPHIADAWTATMPAAMPYDPAYDVVDGKWEEANSSARVANSSGIAYTFALALFEALNKGGHEVPVAIMDTSVGSTGIMCWLSRAKADTVPELKARLRPKSSWNVGPPWNSGYQPYNQPTGLFNAKVAPLANYRVRGFLWSQGENDVGTEATSQYYRIAQKALIEDWRSQFGRADAPFIYAQLAPYDFQTLEGDLEKRAYTREAQLDVFKTVPTTGLIPIHDVNLIWDWGTFGYKHPIHPLTKKPVGERMALAARALAYGENTEFTGPVYESMSALGDKIVVKFTHTSRGLKIKDSAEKLAGFSIAGANRVFVPADAVISGDTVVVSSSAVAAPVAVTYGFTAMHACANLVNDDNLPAPPFRTDKTFSTFVKGCR